MTEHITPTADETKIIADLMAAPHPVTLATIAKALGTTELAAAQKMPEDAVAFVAGDASEKFDDVWAALAAWEKVTLFLVHAGHVFEIQGKLTAGKRAMGYYNILAKDAVVGGHLAYEKIKAAAFVTMPFMGRESLSVLFFDAEGRVSFSVYAGRENHQIIESVKTAFFADREKFCA